MNVALIGAGYWGPNLARVFFGLPGCNLHTICDKKKDRLDSIKASFPNINTTQDYNTLLGNSDIGTIATWIRFTRDLVCPTIFWSG